MINYKLLPIAIYQGMCSVFYSKKESQKELSNLYPSRTIPPITTTSDCKLTVKRIKNGFPPFRRKYFLISEWLAVSVTAPPRSLAYLLVKYISGLN